MSDKKITIVYSEPADYFPKSTRKKYKLGEYAEQPTNEQKKPTKKTPKKK